MGKTARSSDRIGGETMTEENIKKLFETIARIVSEREQVKVTVTVSRKKAAA